MRSTDPKQNGTLVAIAIGGRCDFTVDGKMLKTGVSSLRLKVMVGVHEVTCFNAGKMKRQSVTVSHDKPGIASFRVEPDDTPSGRGSEMFDHGF